MPFRIRPFKKADFDTLWCIDQACFDPQLAYSRPEMAFYMRRPGSFTLVADAGDLSEPGANCDAGENPGAPGIKGPGVLGFIVTEVLGKNGHIITIDVIAAARRLGVGSALLVAAEDRARENGAQTIALETAVNNASAIRFYKQKGYFVEKTIRGYYSNTLDALQMSKSLVGNSPR